MSEKQGITLFSVQTQSQVMKIRFAHFTLWRNINHSLHLVPNDEQCRCIGAVKLLFPRLSSALSVFRPFTERPGCSWCHRGHVALPLCCVSEPTSGGPLCDCPLPNPEMSFHLWTEDVDICKWRPVQSFEPGRWF